MQAYYEHTVLLKLYYLIPNLPVIYFNVCFLGEQESSSSGFFLKLFWKISSAGKWWVFFTREDAIKCQGIEGTLPNCTQGKGTRIVPTTAAAGDALQDRQPTRDVINHSHKPSIGLSLLSATPRAPPQVGCVVQR